MEYKKDQNWVVKSGDYLVFPGGGTQFKDGVTNYIESIQKVVSLLYIHVVLNHTKLHYCIIQCMFGLLLNFVGFHAFPSSLLLSIE